MAKVAFCWETSLWGSSSKTDENVQINATRGADGGDVGCAGAWAHLRSAQRCRLTKWIHTPDANWHLGLRRHQRRCAQMVFAATVRPSKRTAPTGRAVAASVPRTKVLGRHKCSKKHHRKAAAPTSSLENQQGSCRCRRLQSTGCGDDRDAKEPLGAGRRQRQQQ